MDAQKIISYASRCTANRVYPLSIAQGFQNGDIIVDDEVDEKAVLFWHYAGFAYLSGEVTEAFLKRILHRFFVKETDRRFVLITDDQSVIEYFSGKDGVSQDQRIEYRYETGRQTALPACGCRIEPITQANIKRINGRIVPSFSWASEQQYFNNGFGFVAMDGDTVAAAAFSAAVSSDKVDIGVETAEPYRRQGLAAIVADRMCREIVSIGKKPVWAHSISNIGSQRTAERIGFTADRINTVTSRKKPPVCLPFPST